MPAILFILLLLLPATAAADVYKCKGKSGETMYSEHPCDARAEPMKLRDTTPSAAVAPATVAMDNGAQTQQGDSESPAAAESSGELEAIRAAEKSCIADATASIYGPSNDRVGTLQQQMSQLNEQLASANDAERSQALRTRMATFRQAITREHNNAHTQMTNARRRCIELAKTSNR